MSSVSQPDDEFAFHHRARCRGCGGSLESLWDLGCHALTGHFPKPNEAVPSAPMHVTQCTSCTLVQLGHDYSLKSFFGVNYGYRSGLNPSMVSHLAGLVSEVERVTSIEDGDTVIDIGGNDGTTLSKYRSRVRKLLIDPTARNWVDYISSDIEVLDEFFGGPKQVGYGVAKVITSISMLYDLQSPLDFMRSVFDTLKPGGYWITEQSDLDEMLAKNSFDTVCHEHLEYYSREALLSLAYATGFILISDSLNVVNGGSRRFIFQKPEKPTQKIYSPYQGDVSLTLENQRAAFARLARFATELENRLKKLFSEGRVVHGLGASTKGNTLLQVLGLSVREIPYVAEVNERKFGRETPGSRIPIISEAESISRRPDYYLVLPWHFRKTFLDDWQRYANARPVFPLPVLDVL
jgi:hypothetical protein